MTARRWFRLVSALGLVTAAGGCGFDAPGYTIDRYGRAGQVILTLRCRDSYEVYDRPDAGSLIVVTNVLTETLANCLDGGPPLAQRQAQVARMYLTEKANRPLCRLTTERDLSVFHREFDYSCPKDLSEQPDRLPAGTGRRR